MIRSEVRRAALGVMFVWPLLWAAGGQSLVAQSSAQAATPSAPSTARDILGRSTPRGTVLGFLDAGRRGDETLARQYLNIGAGDTVADERARQLFVVLDVRLPANLTQLNNTPDGSRMNPLAPEQEDVGTIEGPDGPVDIVLERVNRPAGAIWLFSAATLDAIAPVFDDIRQRRAQTFVPRFMFRQRVGSVRLFEWMVVLLALGGLYLCTLVLNRVLTAVAGPLGRRFTGQTTVSDRDVLPLPARVLLITLVSRWTFMNLPVSLLVRQHLDNLTALALIVSLAWLAILLNGAFERRLVSRIRRANMAATLSLLRVGRRLGDVVVLFLAAIVLLRHYGIDPTPVVAGLGVGGIAVALAAQKTLENVIAGASLIFDQALRVGDSLRVGGLEGTVDHIGLRSTRIRTPDRSMVTVPNGQIANMSIEILSARDRFWFHPTVGLRYETTPAQLRAVIDSTRVMLSGHPFVDGDSVRVRFLRMGAFSLDVEAVAYVQARDWPHFLELQELLLFQVMDIVTSAGTAVAFPSQTMYLARGRVAETA